jgi:four helix bundle protein
MGEGFRFQRMEIWKRAARVSRKLFELADPLEKQRLYRFAEQLRAATLSITNNIAEGSGSSSSPDFANFLNISRRSVYEVANILLILQENGYLSLNDDELFEELEELSRMIFSFRKTLVK